MMKQHRGGWGRALGGVAAVALVGATGLALSSPSLARPEPQARVVVAATAPAEAPIISKEDIRTLREKCGEARNGAIVCDDDDQDPQVRAIVDKTVKRARVRAAEAMPSPERMAEIEKAIEKAEAEVAKIDHAKIDAEVREALARSRVEIARAERIHSRPQVREALRRARVQIAEARATRQAALASAMAALRANMVRAPLTHEQMAEIREAIDEARREAEEADVDVDVDIDTDFDELNEEVDAELDQLSSIQFPAAGQCSDSATPKLKPKRVRAASIA